MWRFAVQRVAPATAATIAATCATTQHHQQQDDDDKEKAAVSSTLRFWTNTQWLAVTPFTALTAAAHCEAAPTSPDAAPAEISTDEEEEEEEEVLHVKQGFQPNAVGDYHGHFPARQLWKPAVEYPLWYVMSMCPCFFTIH